MRRSAKLSFRRIKKSYTDAMKPKLVSARNGIEAQSSFGSSFLTPPPLIH